MITTHADLVEAGMGEENARRLAKTLKQGRTVTVRNDNATFNIVPRQFAGVWAEFGPRPLGKQQPIFYQTMSEDELVAWLTVLRLPHEPGQQPGELTALALHGGTIDQAACARTIPDRVFEAARVCLLAFPSTTAEHVAERVASYYGYTDPDARRDFIGAIVYHLNHQL